MNNYKLLDEQVESLNTNEDEGKYFQSSCMFQNDWREKEF